VRARKDLVHHRVALANQLRAHLPRSTRLVAFLAGIRYCGSTTAEKMHARITAAPRGATGDTGAAAVHVTRALLNTLRALVDQIDVSTDQIPAHTDAHVLRRPLPCRRQLRTGPTRWTACVSATSRPGSDRWSPVHLTGDHTGDGTGVGAVWSNWVRYSSS